MNKPDMLSVDEALRLLLESARPVSETETVSTLNADGRVLAAPIRSVIDVPERDNSSMDGYAVRASDCASGAARLPITQRLPAGSIGTALAPGSAARIFTGAPIPPDADAVVMQEQCSPEGDDNQWIVVRHHPQPGEWIRRTGEDIRRDSVILEAGMKLTPQATGLAASVGAASLEVYRRLRVAIFFTGDELAMPGEPLPAGKIYNSSRFTLSAMMRALGCQLTDLGIVPDTLAATRAVLRQAAAENDLVMTSGGVSVGEEDHVKPAVEAEGRLDMWKIAMKPGKPLAFGQVRRAAPNGGEAAFIGLPGNPVSSFVCVMLFVRPFVLRAQGATRTALPQYQVRADFDWPRPDARQEFLRVRFNSAGGLDLYPNQSSAVLTSTVWGDGMVDNPPKHPIRRGDSVKFIPFFERGA